MNYGICYQGSKNKLAERIIEVLPRAEHFYDLFAGGCAISHCALLSGKWKHIHISDINDSVILFRDALEGNLPDGSEWISREEFYLRKDTDPYIRLVWSFASNQRDYIYSREIEPYKKAVHEMIYAPTPNERRLKFKEVCRLMEEMYIIGNQENTPPESEPPTRHKLPETASRLQSMERILPPPNYRIFSELQSTERVHRFSKATNGTTDAGRLCQCAPFYVGSMIPEFVITERLKYSRTQSSIVIFRTKTRENTNMTRSTTKRSTIGRKHRRLPYSFQSTQCPKTDSSA